VIGAGLYAYHNSLRGPYIFDDRFVIPANPRIRHLWPLWDALSPPADSAVARRPIVHLSLAINYALGGLDVWGFHAFNLSVHILAALVLWGIVRRTLMLPGLGGRYEAAAPWIATTVALLWVVHPLQTESVTYIVQRTESLMGLFFLLTVYCAVRAAAPPHPLLWSGAAVVSCALGMGSKEVMVGAPLMVVLYDRTFLWKTWTEAFRRRWGLYAGLAATWLVLLALVNMGGRARSAGLGFGGLPPWVYLKTQAGVIVHYLGLVLWPHPLVVDYDDWPVARTLTAALPWGLIVLGLLGATLWALIRRPALGFLGAWFFLILAPTSSILPIITEIAAERRMYLPLAAVLTLIVIGGYTVVEHIRGRWASSAGWPRWLGAALVVACAVALAQVTVRRNEDYRSAVGMWSDVVAKRPNNFRAHLNLGDLLYREGQTDRSRDEFAEAVRLRPTSSDAQYGLGVVLASLGKREEAVTRYREALRINPGYAKAHNNLGTILASEGKREEAAAHFAEAARLDPNNALARFNYGIALSQQGRTGAAIEQLEAAVRLAPSFGDARRLLTSLRSRSNQMSQTEGPMSRP
jgi:tetratricopeptide (TPR) repeat protein